MTDKVAFNTPETRLDAVFHDFMKLEAGHPALLDWQAVRAELAILREHKTQSTTPRGWLPMDLAPKDGTEVDLIEEDGATFNGAAWLLDSWDDNLIGLTVHPVGWRPVSIRKEAKNHA